MITDIISLPACPDPIRANENHLELFLLFRRKKKAGKAKIKLMMFHTLSSYLQCIPPDKEKKETFQMKNLQQVVCVMKYL